jgi:hypothetical protein
MFSTVINTLTPRHARFIPTMTRFVGMAGFALLAALSLGSAGCYRNVVGATGTGSDHYEIKEANIEQGESVWAEPKPTEKVPNRYTGTSLQKNTRPAPQPRAASVPPQ